VWFLQRLVGDGEGATAWAAAATAILPEAERVVWRPRIDRALGYHRLPTESASDDLETWLASWRAVVRDMSTGQWQDKAPDLPGAFRDPVRLIPLAGATGPSRWISYDYQVHALGDQALRALSTWSGFDWRWIVLGDPQVVACLNPASLPPGFGFWAAQPYRDDLRQAVATALAAWLRDHPQAPLDQALASALHHLPFDHWDGLHRVPPAAWTPMVAQAVADRLRRNGAHLPDREEQDTWLPILRLGDAEVLTPVLDALWRTEPWLPQLHLARRALAGDRAAQAAWLDPILAEQPPRPPRTLYSDRQAFGILNPWRNLGVLCHTPTPATYRRLRNALAGDLSRPLAAWLLAQVGQARMPVLGCWVETDRYHRLHNGTYAVMAGLTLTCLADQRPIPATMLGDLGAWAKSWIVDEANPILQSPGVRVCDWTALRLMYGHERLGLALIPDDVPVAAAFIAAPPSERDAAIASLRAAFAPVAQAQLAGADLAEPEGAAGF
jgi:hypothetical protein